ncbi:MAG: hypothetical protein JG765_2181 [Cereibacter sp.]|jgi:hypothetical protein|nr:hypothetical protein [Cereibacter sp.]
MTREDILATASRLVTVERAATHGALDEGLGRIGDLWSIYLGQPVTAVDAAAMLALMKVARLVENPRHVDNWIDLAGYAACGGELATGAGS